MKNQSHLLMLNNLAQKAVMQANKQLGKAQRSQQQAQQQLAVLLNYQDEYHIKLNNTLSNGMTAASWQNYQRFIQTLEQAIDGHKQQLMQCTQKMEQGITHWQKQQQRLSAYEALQERAENIQLRYENCLNQRITDEFAQRHSHRSLIK